MAIKDNPNIVQVEDMVKYLGKHKHVFIYDCKEPQVLIEKFLRSCDIVVDGFLVDYDSQLIEGLPKPVYTLEQAKNSVAIKRCFHKTKKVTNDTCVIVSNEDFMCNWTYNQLKKYGFTEIYFMSEWNKRTIPYKMTPRCKENFWLEVNVADHCNLNCQCCDHFAPIADKYLLDIDEFERDMNRLAELMDGKMGIFKIQGGEPTLHPQLIDFMRITREKFPTSTIFFFTNGILLLSLEKGKNGNLWQAMKDYDVTLMITTYPLNIDFEKLDAKAREYGLKYERFVEVGKVDPHAIGENKYYGKDIDKLSVHHPFDLKGKVPKYEYVSCYQFNESITLRHGKIYTCPFIPYVGYFNKHFNQHLDVTENDFIDIYKAKSYEEIAEFCTHRTDFCKYCDIKHREAKKFAISKKEITEWT